MAYQKGKGVCAQVWEQLDRMAKKRPVPLLRDIMKVSDRKQWNPNNTRTEYYSWRRAHGIYGRVTQ